MSKTDKTKPFWVKLKHRDLHVVADHDHTDGVCNLPAEPGECVYGPEHQTDCRWDFRYTGIHTCCCRLCHSSDEYETRPQKKRRMDGRRACRNWERDYDESWEDRGMWVDNGGYAGAWNVENWYDQIIRDDDDDAHLYLDDPEAAKYLAG